MKKKNVLMMALSLALVAVIAVGGTLAYLTADTGALTNTFRFTANGIDLTLTETATAGEGYTIDKTSASESDGISYTDIIPGAELSKVPVLTVEPSPSDCYVYACVTGIFTENTADFWTEWTAPTEDPEKAGWEVVVSEGTGANQKTLLRYSEVVLKSEVDQHLTEIFNTVYVSNNLEFDEDESVSFNDVVIKGYAVQTSITAAEADAAAKTAFEFTPVEP